MLEAAAMDAARPSGDRHAPRWLGTGAERSLYALWAGVATLWVACLFYGSMRQQILYTSGQALASPNDWSGPLDDVFIHFDFARASARGHPFQWSEGNGYSSGGTSLLYPFVLSLGYLIGFRKLSLMVWAGVIACVSTFALLLAARRLFRDLPNATSYLVPPALLGIGVLAWSLFSGMEVAFFLAVWGAALIAWDDLTRGVPGSSSPARPWLATGLLGFWCAVLVATRPEAAVVVAVFALSAGWSVRRSLGTRRALWVPIIAGAPAAAILVAQTLANQILTGDATAAGALVKLELHHPHLSAIEAYNAWKFHVEYQLRRVAEYHLSGTFAVGYVPFALGALALAFRETRRWALLLWASAICWVLMVALNGQVRWQNERYTMPALSWVLLAACLGLGAAVTKTLALGRRGLVLRVALASLALSAAGTFAVLHRPKFRDQVWFFGRASRNIRDQHIRTGRLLRDMLPTPPRRVLLGDAGAIPYAADLPALDIIGLGGMHGLPFARATRQGVGAAVELIERMPPGERPDIMALYPSWWGVLPLWFGQVIGEVPVTGNVICGGAAKVLYRPDWSALDGSDKPFSLGDRESVVDELDLADVVSEREHAYSTTIGIPHVEMKRLAHPREPHRDLFDAGRIVPQGHRARFDLRGPERGRSARIIVRMAPPRRGRLAVKIGDRPVGELAFEHADGFIELGLELPADLAEARLPVEVEAIEGEHALHHLWLVQPR
jgi:hypothetical protein